VRPDGAGGGYVPVTLTDLRSGRRGGARSGPAGRPGGRAARQVEGIRGKEGSFSEAMA
jgi:hypothetical protein